MDSFTRSFFCNIIVSVGVASRNGLRVGLTDPLNLCHHEIKSFLQIQRGWWFVEAKKPISFASQILRKFKRMIMDGFMLVFFTVWIKIWRKTIYMWWGCVEDYIVRKFCYKFSFSTDCFYFTIFMRLVPIYYLHVISNFTTTTKCVPTISFRMSLKLNSFFLFRFTFLICGS